jgi:hypothetical protein
MDASDWFRFVVVRANGSDVTKHYLTLQGFCSEMNRFFCDRRETGFQYQLLQDLFTSMTKNNDIEDSNNVLSADQFESFMNKSLSLSQQIRGINNISLEMHPLRFYILKNNVSLQNILDVTDSEVFEGKINISQLEFLISSLMLMFEIYCEENGEPSEKEIAELDKAELEKERKENLEKAKSMKILDNSEDYPSSPKKRPSFAAAQLAKMVSSVGFSAPPDFSLISTISSIKRSFSIRTSFAAPVVPTESDTNGEEYDAFNSNLDEDVTYKPSISIKGSMKSQKSLKNLPVEINSEFMTSLNGDARMKVVSLLKHMKESGDENDEIDSPTPLTEKPPLGKMASTFIKGVSSKFLLGSGSGSTKATSLSSQPSGNFIVIDTTDEDEDLDYLRYLSGTRSLSGDESPKHESPKESNNGILISEAKRRSSINHKNYYEEMKHTMLDQKDFQIKGALKFNKVKLF